MSGRFWKSAPNVMVIYTESSVSDTMGRRKAWVEDVECAICHTVFTKKFSNAKYCSPECARIARKAQKSVFGRDLLENHPEIVREWYG